MVTKRRKMTMKNPNTADDPIKLSDTDDSIPGIKSEHDTSTSGLDNNEGEGRSSDRNGVGDLTSAFVWVGMDIRASLYHRLNLLWETQLTNFPVLSHHFKMNHMNPMTPAPFAPITSPPAWLPMFPPMAPPSSAFWETRNVQDRLRELHETVDLAKAMKKELELLIMMKDGKGSTEGVENPSDGSSIHSFSKFLEDNKINLASQQSVSLDATNGLISSLRNQLEPFRVAMDEASPWEEKSMVVRLANKMQKNKRNKLWRKRKRKRIAEMCAKERERFDQADQEADEWRAKEIAKDIAQRKVEKMKEIAKLKAKEERKKLQAELDLVLIVEKLQELRSIRIQKLKKQGHFFPEEDDKFLERVRAAVEEEERQALVAAATDAAKDAIATAEESRKIFEAHESESVNLRNNINSGEEQETKEQKTEDEADKDSKKQVFEAKGVGGAYDSIANLPIEFYHYYHGGNRDMGTLIEVRRTWDAYIRPGGSRIPGHWVQPPPPADEIWASYLVKPN